MVGHNVNKQRNHIMNENKPKVATWVLCVDIDPDNNPEYDQCSSPHLTCRWTAA